MLLFECEELVRQLVASSDDFITEVTHIFDELCRLRRQQAALRSAQHVASAAGAGGGSGAAVGICQEEVAGVQQRLDDIAGEMRRVRLVTVKCNYDACQCLSQIL